MSQSKQLQTGDKAPEFCLPGQDYHITPTNCERSELSSKLFVICGM